MTQIESLCMYAYEMLLQKQFLNFIFGLRIFLILRFIDIFEEGSPKIHFCVVHNI